MLLGGLYVGKKVFWPAAPVGGGVTPPDSPAPKYPSIPGTAVVETADGPVRYFDAMVAQNALRNLAAVYNFLEGTTTPAVGAKFARLVHQDSGFATRGLRAFDWALARANEGFYVATLAPSGSGPWTPANGDDYMIAVAPADMKNPKILNEWAVVAGPHSLNPALATLETEALLTQLETG